MPLEIEEIAIQTAAAVIRLTRSFPRDLSKLKDQADRAAMSAALNISEATGRASKSRRYHFRVAYGSAREARAALLIAHKVGAFDDPILLDQLDRIAATTWRLMKR